MRVGDFPKQDKCRSTDSVEGKNNRAGGPSQHRNGVLWATAVCKAVLGSPGEFRGNMNFLVSRSSSCLTVNLFSSFLNFLYRPATSGSNI